MSTEATRVILPEARTVRDWLVRIQEASRASRLDDGLALRRFSRGTELRSATSPLDTMPVKSAFSAPLRGIRTAQTATWTCW
jgi:hypothetical protein